MTSFKIIITSISFIFLIIYCKKKQNDVFNEKNNLENTTKLYKINQNILAHGQWQIKNVKHLKGGVLQNKKYFDLYKNSELKFVDTKELILNDENIGYWNDTIVTIRDDSLKGRYYYQKMNDLIQLIQFKNNSKEDYLLINIMPIKQKFDTISVKKELIDFNK